jgi:hypothetical protein
VPSPDPPSAEATVNPAAANASGVEPSYCPQCRAPKERRMRFCSMACVKLTECPVGCELVKCPFAHAKRKILVAAEQTASATEVIIPPREAVSDTVVSVLPAESSAASSHEKESLSRNENDEQRREVKQDQRREVKEDQPEEVEPGIVFV